MLRILVVIPPRHMVTSSAPSMEQSLQTYTLAYQNPAGSTVSRTAVPAGSSQTGQTTVIAQQPNPFMPPELNPTNSRGAVTIPSNILSHGQYSTGYPIHAPVQQVLNSYDDFI